MNFGRTTSERMIRFRLITAVFFSVFLFQSFAFAIDDETSRKSLQGIKEVAVSIGIDEDAKRLGAAENIFQTDVELRLRKAGVKVSPRAKFCLCVNITTEKIFDLPIYAYTVQEAISQ